LISFYSKIPIVPLHNWLPEAHVEAPTELSVLLAGLILKVGTYGFLRIILPIFPSSFYYLSPVLLIFVTISVFYSSATAVSQSDIKKIIAYSSIAHMNISIIGLCVGTVVSICGSVFLMFSHGIISSGLFFLIGMLYERYGTKIVKYYTGLICFMPLFSVFFFLSVLGNIGFPFMWVYW
jgi:NADH:ubiquinone oxidoreductase subunit 4 (subunit M)